MTKRGSRALWVVITVCALVLALARHAAAGAATDVIKAKQTSLYALLKVGTPETQKKTNAIYDEMFDYDAMAQSSLEPEWAARSNAEKVQFTDLLKQIVRKAYERNLKKTLSYNVEYIGEEAAAGAIVVKTKSKPPGDKGEVIEMKFRLMQKSGAWKVLDITTEGVSMIGGYRSQFVKIIKKDGFPVLITKMKDKIAKGDV